MFCNSDIRFTGAIALPLCLLVSACGGDGSYGVASTPPPPPTPTPTPASSSPLADAYPITRAGTYDLIGTTRYHGTSSEALALTVSKAPDGQGFIYDITGPAGFLPIEQKSLSYGPKGSWDLSSNGYLRGAYSQRLPYNAEKQLSTALNFDAGYSYVSMGEWSWYFVHSDGGTADGGYGELLFVAGDRTPEAGIPTSGIATYDAHTLTHLASSGGLGIPFTLTADFGQRTISTRIDQDYRAVAGDIMDDPIPGIHIAGNAPFTSNGSFVVPLTGTANYDGWNQLTAPPAQQVTGDLKGSFFGPHAEQVGGVFSLTNPAGLQVIQDAFVGQQHP